MSAPSNARRATLNADLIHAVRLFIAASSMFSHRVADRLGLHPTDVQFLNVLELQGPLTPKVLGHYSGLSSGGVTVVLNRLEREGYVRRRSNPKDGRSVVVDIVPVKLREVKANYVRIEQQFTDQLASSSVEELRTVLQFFHKMNAARSTDS